MPGSEATDSISSDLSSDGSSVVPIIFSFGGSWVLFCFVCPPIVFLTFSTLAPESSFGKGSVVILAGLVLSVHPMFMTTGNPATSARKNRIIVH